MPEEKLPERYVGPVMRVGDLADAVLDAIRIDNNEREIDVDEHASYIRIKVLGLCVIHLDTVSKMVGRKITRGDIEMMMPSFEGFITPTTDSIVFRDKY